MDFQRKLAAAWEKNNSLLCIGLDPDLSKLPPQLQETDSPYFIFNKAIIDATHDLVCAYKPNSAFYEARGAAGIEELQLTCEYLEDNYPDIPIILDYKRGDIGNTNDHYATFAFEYLGGDAITIQPYLGRDAVQPFLDHKDKGILVLAKTSNAGSGEFQDLTTDGSKLYQQVAQNVAQHWNANKNCGLVIGATYPEELAAVRKLVGEDMVLLVPGIGAQGGDVEATIKAGRNAKGTGLIINTSRAVLYASPTEDYADIARAKAIELVDEINKYR